MESTPYHSGGKVGASGEFAQTCQGECASTRISSTPIWIRKESSRKLSKTVCRAGFRALSAGARCDEKPRAAR